MYFSGFCFHDEEELFEAFISKRGVYDICGFSYGAQKAMDLAFQRAKNHWRIHRLILLSPAIFQQKNHAYKAVQINAFQKNPQSYVDKFLRLCGVDASVDENIARYTHLGDLFELTELLGYVWDSQKLRQIADLGVEIAVYLGGEDKIIDPIYAMDFFAPFSRVCLIKTANHCLKTSS
ncbi:pimelyl-ACP methyl ester esterase BioV [Helicobacter sp. 11S02596-1]|uniref:pimelyl-ACP methyl ester esterase BioV n=1 Tax=Helicobacter sp. 11S02596-1 TaxID=1476194 RepID=UPI000BA594C9|nr:pimelyl-ACP methyl ester esterase BioV [Helicobacter sp. 11S02596-1]PAF42117.1 hypothetical protein BJI48_07350 [Helicobacter sp. 11S02596-1]